MDGVEMLRRLAKQSGARRPPPAVLLLPGGREELRGEARAAGAHGLVELPYDPVELLETLGGVPEVE
jgi:CheY-like chemotaxis protein